jgi:hypothetical protein
MQGRLVRWLPGLASLAFGLGLLALTLQLDVDLQRNVGGAIGPEAYPGLLAAAILLLALLLLWQAARGRVEADPDASMDATPAGRAGYQRVVLALALLCGFTLLLEPLGFLIAMPLMLVLLMRLTGDRRWWLTLPAALLMTLLLYGFFRYGMNLVLPEGLLGERI